MCICMRLRTCMCVSIYMCICMCNPASITETVQHTHATAEDTETCMTCATRVGGAVNLANFPG